MLPPCHPASGPGYAVGLWDETAFPAGRGRVKSQPATCLAYVRCRSHYKGATTRTAVVIAHENSIVDSFHGEPGFISSDCAPFDVALSCFRSPTLQRGSSGRRITRVTDEYGTYHKMLNDWPS